VKQKGYLLMTDLQGKKTDELKRKKLFLFDMDGTVYEEGRVFNGTLELMNYIHEIGGEYVFITNNSSKSVEDYKIKLIKMGIFVESKNFFTSAQATALYLKKAFTGKRVFCLGTRSLIKELKSYGIDATGEKDLNTDVVVVSYDTELTYDKLYNVCELITKGLPYIATNPDKVCPVKFGFVPDCAAICEMIYFATNRRPRYIGKPDPVMVEFAVKNSKYTKKQAVVIGDRLYTDIVTGVNAGVTTICVLSGETKWKDIPKSKVKPDYVINGVADLLKIIKE